MFVLEFIRIPVTFAKTKTYNTRITKGLSMAMTIYFSNQSLRAKFITLWSHKTRKGIPKLINQYTARSIALSKTDPARHKRQSKCIIISISRRSIRNPHGLFRLAFSLHVKRAKAHLPSLMHFRRPDGQSATLDISFNRPDYSGSLDCYSNPPSGGGRGQTTPSSPARTALNFRIVWSLICKVIFAYIYVLSIV